MSGTDNWHDCAHYYADRSGGFGWPSCVMCGKPQPSDPGPRVALLVCCGNPEDQGHTGACTSMDAVAKRKQAAGDRLPLTRAWIRNGDGDLMPGPTPKSA
ncbi:hypothetical protein R2325_02655 [Mycobacteroides chelonae]|nr:hypothetical protein [Mycobacteroides chelonae]MEC4869472.1 hypothetical protein [Mycobacteroides chelonae]